PGYSDPANFIGAYNSRNWESWPGIVVRVVDRFNNQVTDPEALKALTTGSVAITAKNSGGTAIKFADGQVSKTASIDPNTGVATFAPNPNGTPGNALQIGAPNVGNDLKLTAFMGGAITGASNAGPIVITSPNHGLKNGVSVTIAGVEGNKAANGTFTVTVLGKDTFSLDGSQGNGAYQSGTGTWTPVAPPLKSVDSQPFNLGVQRQNSTFSPDGQTQETFALKIDPTTPVPSSFPVGKVLPTIKVNLYGKDDKPLTNDSTDRIRMVTGGLLGTLTVTAQNGVATFNDLVIGGKSGLDAGTPTLTLNFTYADLPLGGVNSSPITLTAGQAAGLAFVTPGGAIT